MVPRKYSIYHFIAFVYRYQVIEFPGGSLLRIEPVRRKPDVSEIECRAENGAGDAVYAKATLTVYDGKRKAVIVILEA